MGLRFLCFCDITIAMKIRVMLSVLSCKLSRFAIRLLGRGGTDFPGRVALKVCPNVLGYLAKNVTTIIVTGTNGKTSVSTMLDPNRAWLMAGSGRKPMAIAYTAETPISLEIDPMRNAAFEVGINLTIALDMVSVFSSRLATFTI